MTMHATAAVARKYERADALGHAYEAQSRQRVLRSAIYDTVRALRLLLECGVDRTYLDDTVAGLHDAASNADHECRVIMDEASIHAEHIDLSEVRELLEQVRK